MSWRDDEAFMIYLIDIAEVAWRNADGSIGHRISGGDDGVNIVWVTWKEGRAEGDEIAREMGLL